MWLALRLLAKQWIMCMGVQPQILPQVPALVDRQGLGQSGAYRVV